MIVLRALYSRLPWFIVSDLVDTVRRWQRPCRITPKSIIIIVILLSCLIHKLNKFDGTIKETHDKCTNEKKRSEFEENCRERGTAIIMILTIGTGITFSAFTFSVHAHSPTLALSDTFFDFSANNLHITAVMLLYRGFLNWWNCPFDLESTSITCEILGKFELFSFDVSFRATTRKRAVLICWFI